MKKSIFSKVIAVMLSMAVLASLYITAVAEAEGEEPWYVGTETDGISTLFKDWSIDDGSSLPACTANENADGTIGSYSLNNGDFNNGLKYWGLHKRNNVVISTLSQAATVETDPQNKKNKALKLNITADQANRDNIGIVVSAPFTIPNVSAGDYLNAKFKVYSDSVASANFELHQVVKDDETPVDTILLSSSGYGDKTVTTLAKQWKEIVINSNSNWKNGLSVQPGVNSYFYITFRLCNESTIYFDDFEIVNTSNDGTAKFVGSTAKGITKPGATLADWNITNLSEKDLENFTINADTDGKTYSLNNGNFDRGLQYWGLSKAPYSTRTSITDIAEVIEVDGNKYLKVTPHTDGTAVVSAPFKLNGVKAGDTLNVKLNVRFEGTGEVAGIVNLHQVVDGDDIKLLSSTGSRVDNGHKSNCNSSDHIYMKECDSDWHTTTIGENSDKVSSGDWYNYYLNLILVQPGQNSYFYLEFGGTTEKFTYYFDDIKVVKASSADYNNRVDSKDAYNLVEVDGNGSLKLSSDFKYKYDLGQGAMGISFEENTMKFNLDSKARYYGFESKPIALPEIAKGKSVRLVFNVAKTANAPFTLNACFGGKTDVINTVKLTGVYGTDGDLASYISEPVQVPADAEYFYWDFRSVKTAGATISLANLQLIYDDIGGMQGKYSTISGNVYGGYEIGDANADKDFNICDIVRANNYVTATGAKPEIYFSAANVAERDQGILDDNDTTELIKMLLNKAE